MRRNELTHILLWNAVDVDLVPESGQHVSDVRRIALLPPALFTNPRVSRREGLGAMEEETYIVHAFSFARMNSEIVRKGIPRRLITVDGSSLRGPSSPEGSISIYGGTIRMDRFK